MIDKKGKVLISAGAILIVLAIALVAYNIIGNYYSNKSSQLALTELESQITQNEDINYKEYPEMDMPVISVDGVEYIGKLEIPTLDLSLPVINEWSYKNLRISPCRYTGSAYQNNLIIAAHNYQSHFGKIKQLAYGDEVIFTDVNSNKFYYKVCEIEKLNPTATEDIQLGDWDLTLFTCTIGGKSRVVVRCEAVDK